MFIGQGFLMTINCQIIATVLIAIWYVYFLSLCLIAITVQEQNFITI